MARKVDPQTLTDLNPHQVLSFKQWIALVGISEATGWRLLHGRKGPPFIRIGERKVGIKFGDHQAWLDKRVRASA
jgi:predicted DNA-binding transcriptional regulator AlpA